MIDLKEIADSMVKKDLIFTYQGVVNDDIVKDMLQLAESSLEAESVKANIKRRVYRVFLEGIQNLYKHQNDAFKDNEMSEVTIVLARKDSFYKLILGNYVESNAAVKLKTSIDFINSHGQDELKQKYREVLNDNTRTKGGGSGLGLMDIARKTGEPLEYNFTEVNDEISYFTLHIKICYNG